jgi:hypothetical protein
MGRQLDRLLIDGSHVDGVLGPRAPSRRATPVVARGIRASGTAYARR